MKTTELLSYSFGSESDSEELRSFRPVSHSFSLGSWDLMNSHSFFGLGSLATELYYLVLARSLFGETLFTLQPHKVKTMFISRAPSHATDVVIFF